MATPDKNQYTYLRYKVELMKYFLGGCGRGVKVILVVKGLLGFWVGWQGWLANPKKYFKKVVVVVESDH